MSDDVAILDNAELEGLIGQYSGLTILRRLPSDWLQRINPETAKRDDSRSCPLAQACCGKVITGWSVASHLEAAHQSAEQDREDVWAEAREFIRLWDNKIIAAPILARAIELVLLERENAEAYLVHPDA